jgi:hypothetical protein
MNISRSAGIMVFLGVVLGLAWGGDKPAAPASAQLPPLLPQQFGGWQMQGAPETSTNPAAADPTNAAILKEYRFTDFASSTYTREDSRTLKIRAARFADASGAFGAYTFYLQPEMAREQIGDQAASMGPRVLFYRGHVLVDALFSRPTVMSGAELRELAGVLPRPAGGAGNLPTFIQFMPRRGYIANTQKYVMGPEALAVLAPPVSAEQVDFSVSTEVALGHYHTSSGEATLMLISYPTPQLAADHLRRMDTSQQQAQPQAGVSTIGKAGPLFYKRTGPLIAIAAGAISDSDAKSLLSMVNYEASVTWNQASDQQDIRDLYLLIINVVIICVVVGGLAIVAGVAFGGFRILMKRWFPDKIFDRPEQMEFIALHLAETMAQGPPESGSEGAPPAPPKAS